MILLSILLVVATGIFFFLKRPDFGRPPSRQKVQEFRNFSNYTNSFQNLSATPALTEGATYTGVMKDFFLNRNKKRIPPAPIPSVKTDLISLDPTENVLVWFGHSSYFIQLDGKKILVDPVFSGNASPIPNSLKSFPGADIYTAEDIPYIDYLLITHDHWDHLDYKTIIKLKKKIRHIYTGLGVGDHLESWGFNKAMITEKNWNETIVPDPGFTIITAPARHFSGRSFRRNISLWSSFILITPSMKIYIGGDSGYDSHFGEIGKQHGPFDLTILECGQYNKNWKYIHMMPEEVVKAAADLRSKNLMIVHWAKFPLADHDWNEPGKKVSLFAAQQGMPLATPLIGEKMELMKTPYPQHHWWKTVEA